jgi:methionine-rich copper-binding protein CopC
VIRSCILTVVAALLAVSAMAGQASAHTSLSSTAPVENSTVAAPTEIVLTFVDSVTLPQVVVLDAKGKHHEKGRPYVIDNKVSVKINGTLPGGVYTVGWRAVSPDGHPITSDYRFTVKGGATEATATAAEDSSTGGSGLLWLCLGGVAVVLVATGIVWARRVPAE